MEGEKGEAGAKRRRPRVSGGMGRAGEAGSASEAATEDTKSKRARRPSGSLPLPPSGGNVPVSNADAAPPSATAESDPLTPAFLLQLLKLLKRKEALLDRAKLQNDAMSDLRRRPADGSGASKDTDKDKEAALKREYAWCVVQVDRVNFQLRNALWGVALGMGGGMGPELSQGGVLSPRTADDEEASARDSLIALSRGCSRDDVPPHGARAGGTRQPRNELVKKCDESAATLLRAVVASADGSPTAAARRISHGTATVQPLVAQCLSLLLLLRNFEQHTASSAAVAAARRAHSQAASTQERTSEKQGQLKLWEESFSGALEQMPAMEGANAVLFAEVVASIKSLKASISK